MNPERSIPAAQVVFSVVCSLVYLLAVWKNYALFTYHPAVGEFAWGVEKARDGVTPMYWYGWIATSVISGFAAALLTHLLPARISGRLWPGAAWLAPLCAMAIIGYILRHYFLH